jgi:hypothetical protein
MNRLIKHVYLNHKDIWLEYNKPGGLFWKPDEDYNKDALGKFIYKWMFASPKWILNDLKAHKVLKKLRVCFFVWNIGCISFWIVPLVLNTFLK